jgi:hypothetical protein
VTVFGVIVLLPGCYWIGRAFETCRGTIFISANADGINFENTPGKRSGFIPRETIESLTFVIDERGLSLRPYFRVQVHQYGIWKPQVLARGRNSKALSELRNKIVKALGMELSVD